MWPIIYKGLVSSVVEIFIIIKAFGIDLNICNFNFKSWWILCTCN